MIEKPHGSSNIHVSLYEISPGIVPFISFILTAEFNASDEH